MAKLAGSPPPPVVLKLKVPSPPLVCLCTVRLATAWLVKLQLPADPAVVSAKLPQPPLELKPAVANSETLRLAPAAAVTTYTEPGGPLPVLEVDSGGSQPAPMVGEL